MVAALRQGLGHACRAMMPTPAAPPPPMCVWVGGCDQAWELTGDAYTKRKGDRPWISEM